MFTRLIVLAALALALSANIVSAQFPGVAQDLLARGRMDYAQPVDGPADVYIGSIRMEPGGRYGGWHTHPGPVLVIVTAGELAVYGPDNCRTVYTAGSAYIAEPDTLYDLRNETAEFVDLYFAGIVRAGEPATVLAGAPAVDCAP